MRKSQFVESDHHSSAQAEIVLQTNLCSRNLPLATLSSQLQAQLRALSKAWKQEAIHFHASLLGLESTIQPIICLTTFTQTNPSYIRRFVK